MPREISMAQGHQAQTAALYELRHVGNASSIDSYCGAAVMEYSGAGELVEVDPPTTLFLTHRSSKCSGGTVPQRSTTQGSPQVTARRPAEDSARRKVEDTARRAVEETSPSLPSRKVLENSPSWKVIRTPLQAQRELLSNGDHQFPPALAPAVAPAGRRMSLTNVVNQLRTGDLRAAGAPLRRTIPSGATCKQQAGNTIVTPQWLKELAQQRAPNSPVLGARESLGEEKPPYLSSPAQQSRKAPDRTPQMSVRASPPQVHRVALPANSQRNTAASMLLKSPRLSLGSNSVTKVVSGLSSPPAMQRPMSVRSSVPMQASGYAGSTTMTTAVHASPLQPVGTQLQSQAVGAAAAMQSQAAGAQQRKLSPQRLRSLNGWVEDAFVAF